MVEIRKKKYFEFLYYLVEKLIWPKLNITKR